MSGALALGKRLRFEVWTFRTELLQLLARCERCREITVVMLAPDAAPPPVPGINVDVLCLH